MHLVYAAMQELTTCGHACPESCEILSSYPQMPEQIAGDHDPVENNATSNWLDGRR